MRNRTSLAFSPGAAGPLLANPWPDLPWQLRGLCAETDPGAFFPEDGEPAGPAKRVCRSCPVRAECLDYALSTGQEYGVWGGMSEQERRQLKPAADGQPAERRCLKGLHVMTTENTGCDGRCRACRRSSNRRRAASGPTGRRRAALGEAA